MCVSASLFLLSWQEDLGLNGYGSYYYCFTLYHNHGLMCITRWYCPIELKPGQVFRSSGKVAQGYSSRKGRSPSYLPSINSIFLICMTEYCVKIFNIRPYRYMGPISQGEALGYLLPLQERFSGITSHMELQMCDRSDPSPYIWTLLGHMWQASIDWGWGHRYFSESQILISLICDGKKNSIYKLQPYFSWYSSLWSSHVSE